ncbi:ATP-binding cassette domain-containing protein [Escherichia coli]|uniref:ATP-binding cassette domain-containing protein n=1 Tax=Escherichia coli TaxID=562 RepID=UPI003B640054
MGESGSGKSTTGLALLRLINSQGSIIFDGQPLQNLNRRQLLPIRHRIQVVFQDPNSSLNPRLNVLHYRHAVGQFSDNAEVMSNKQHAHIQLALQFAQQL